MNTIQCQGIITSISSKVDRSLGLRIQTPELTTEEKALFMEIQGASIDITFVPIEENNAPAYTINKDLDTKPPSVRLRNTLFRVWESQGSQGNFDDYYKQTMEKLIEHFKEKLV